MKKLFLCFLLLLLCTLPAFAKTVYVSDGGTGDGSTARAPLGSLTDAFDALGTDGGEILLCGTVTLPKNAIGTTQNAFVEPAHTGKVTLAGDGNAALLFNGVYQYHLSGETEFCDLTLSSGAYTSGIDIAGRGYPLTMGENLKMESTGSVSGEVGTKIYLYGGCRNGVTRAGYESANNTLTVKSGSYWFIGGFNRNLNVTSTGRATLTLGGEVHTRFLIAGSTGTSAFAYPSGADIFLVGDLSVSNQISMGNQNSDADSFTTNLILQNGKIDFTGSVIDYTARKRLTGFSVYTDRRSASAVATYSALFAGYGDFEGGLSDYCTRVRGGHDYRNGVCTVCALTRAAAECTVHDYEKSVSGTVVSYVCKTCGDTFKSTTKTPAGSGVYTCVSGNVRVQVLGDGTVRIEEKHKDGFNDAPTLLVPTRSGFSGTPVAADSDADTYILRFGDTVINLPQKNACAADVTLHTEKGEVLFDYFATPKNGFYASLPAPAATPGSFVLTDNGILPAKDGLTYTGSTDPQSDWRRTDSTDLYILLPRGDAAALRRDFTALTGRTELLNIKALGFWYSKWTNDPSAAKLAMIERYRKTGHPLDMIVIDTEWKDTSTGGNDGDGTGYGINTELYPDMEKFLTDANDAGVLVLFNDHTHKTSSLITDPAELQWQSAGIRSLLEMGLDGWWYDRNWTYTLKSPYADVQYSSLGQVLYRDTIHAHNESVSDGETARTLLLSNADWIKHGHSTGAPGLIGHRYGVQWTGDIYGDTVQLKAEIENAVNAGVMGASPYLSADLGGFRNVSTSQNTFIRWMQFGAFAPIFRVHSTLSKANLQHPWSAGSAAESIIAKYTDMRYHLMPYFYALAHENYESGLPLCRRLDFAYPAYPESQDSTEYLLGDDILVAPLWYTAGDGAGVVPTDWFDGGLSASYYNITSSTPAADYFTGTAAATGSTDAIDFFWEGDAPAPGVSDDWFTAVFSGRVTPDADGYLGVLADDGVQVYIDGILQINALSGKSSVTVMDRDHVLHAGETHEICVRYLEKTGKARLYLLYEPILEENTSSRTVFFPDGDWMDVFTGEIHTGPVTETVVKPIASSPIYVRMGAILPVSAVISPMTGADWQALTLNLYGAADGSTLLYEDDGESEAYMHGEVRKTDFTAKTVGDLTTVAIGAADGDFTTDYTSRTITFRIHSRTEVLSAAFDGKPVGMSAVPAEENAVPFAESGADPVSIVYTVTVDADPALSHTFTYTLSPLGDMDGDGILQLQDALLLLRSVVNGAPMPAGDLNRDGRTSLADVLLVLKQIAR